MADLTDFKRYLIDADNEAAAYNWATTAMEVRGLIQLPGTRKRRSDAGQARVTTLDQIPPVVHQPSLTGLPDEDAAR